MVAYAFMRKARSKWKLIGNYPVRDYKCGARAGDRVRLRQDLVICDHKGKPTGAVHREGEVWCVLSGSVEPPVDIWLRRPDGDRQTWTDDDDFWKWFEKVAP